MQTKHFITSLVGATLVLALLYTLETNQIEEDTSLLSDQRSIIKELRLDHQGSLEKLSLIHLGKDVTMLQQELELEQVKGFTLLHPKPSQLSLNERPYEL